MFVAKSKRSQYHKTARIIVQIFHSSIGFPYGLRNTPQNFPTRSHLLYVVNKESLIRRSNLDLWQLFLIPNLFYCSAVFKVNGTFEVIA